LGIVRQLSLKLQLPNHIHHCRNHLVWNNRSYKIKVPPVFNRNRNIAYWNSEQNNMNPHSRSEQVNCFCDTTSISNFIKLMFLLCCSEYHNKRKTDELIDLQNRKKHASEECVTGTGFSQKKQVCIGFLVIILNFYFVRTYYFKQVFHINVFLNIL